MIRAHLEVPAGLIDALGRRDLLRIFAGSGRIGQVRLTVITPVDYVTRQTADHHFEPVPAAA